MVLARGLRRLGSLVITRDIFDSPDESGTERELCRLAAAEAASVTLSRRAPDKVQRDHPRSTLTLSPSVFFPPSQDLSPGQEQLPARLRGRRRDGGGRATAPPDAGLDLFLLLRLATSNQCKMLISEFFKSKSW